MKLLNSFMFRPRGAMRLSLREDTLAEHGMVAIDLIDDDEDSGARIALWCDGYDPELTREAIDAFNTLMRAAAKKRVSARIIPIREGANA